MAHIETMQEKAGHATMEAAEAAAVGRILERDELRKLTEAKNAELLMARLGYLTRAIASVQAKEREVEQQLAALHQRADGMTSRLDGLTLRLDHISRPIVGPVPLVVRSAVSDGCAAERLRRELESHRERIVREGGFRDELPGVVALFSLAQRAVEALEGKEGGGQ